MRMIALLRGINVGGNRKVSMAELRTVAAEAGFSQIETYINSGNLLFDPAKMNASQASAQLERAIQKHFGFSVEVIVRTARQWKTYASGGPFRDVAELRPNLLMVGLSGSPISDNAENLLGERAAQHERVKIVGDAIWIDFGASSGKSKLTPALLDKAAGSPVTLRNWRTVLKLAEMLSGESKIARLLTSS